MKFVDVRNDVAFKKIFGNENKKGILISFLNSVLDLSGDRVIDDITILNPYQAPDITTLKESILDIRARDKRGIIFIVEIQIQKKAGFQKRVLYYTSKAYIVQLDKGNDYPKLNQVIFIGIVNFNAFDGSDYLTRHRIYFIKNAGSMQIMPASANFDEIREAYEIATEMLWDKKELEVYEYWQMRSNDETWAFVEGKNEGKIEGKLEGLLEGIAIVLEMKYGDRGTALMGRVRGLGTIEALERFKGVLKTSVSIEELKGFFE
ncbi:MAG: Rpn family recombination-promoting nuclease/putative transposase [Nitrospirae bacterium]|uniref:Rpn family recombination-promoting nuclease/putative transposase n=1 Tax=Candidatus Magnetobacterium casense TaxID=1455061 RepID=UPI000695C951|nr:Rpn family recombination-promoting nuclease/putative transposase [Candidatus Magnetobacterium casensis]MBF0339240.1 Rpn family recombination-promoting nuclease/putative transposase [Nitrospirota bacterium]